MKNRNVMIITLIASTGKCGFTIDRPSTADSTVIDGAITPSASSEHPPMMAMMNSLRWFLRSKAKSEKMPPSPRLSAFSVIKTYFTVVCRVSVHTIHDSAPMIVSALTVPIDARMALKT